MTSIQVRTLKVLSAIFDNVSFLGGISSFKTESYEQLNDVKFEGFKLDNRPNTSGASTSEMGTLSENTERLREETNQLLRSASENV